MVSAGRNARDNGQLTLGLDNLLPAVFIYKFYERVPAPGENLDISRIGLSPENQP